MGIYVITNNYEDVVCANTKLEDARSCINKLGRQRWHLIYVPLHEKL